MIDYYNVMNCRNKITFKIEYIVQLSKRGLELNI
jgi:hypothetical protein